MPEPQSQRGIVNRGYQIYALIDPRDNLIHYVGLSISAESRFIGHISGQSGNVQEKQWILDLQQQGLIPILQILETIEPGNNAYSIACEEEFYWIREMASQGHPLLNISGVIRTYVPAPMGKPRSVGIQSPIEEQSNGNILEVENLSVISDAIIPDISIPTDMPQGEDWLTTDEIAKDFEGQRQDGSELDKFG